MEDIRSREDIEVLVNNFYNKVRKDDVIGYIFQQIIGDDWSHHLPIMYSFWETVLLNNAGYSGNPIKKHIEIDKKVPLQQEHYERWLQLWHETLDNLFAGEVTETAKIRAAAMMQLIDMKVQWAREGKSIL
ncbi:MAG TPA: group III truncated hemoglobin [Flavipsychrobacter sp.]